MTYSEKLKDPRWQKKRLRILDRDNWRCQECATESKQLQVHHVVYMKCEPWDYPDYLFQTFCEPCHKERQELTDKIVNAVKMAIAPVPTVRLIPMALEICSQAMLKIDIDPGFPIYSIEQLEPAYQRFLRENKIKDGPNER